VRILNLIEERSRECLVTRAERRWSSAKVIEALADVMVMKGVPEHLVSDNGPEFVAKDLRQWLADTGAKTLYIEPGSPWENDYCESFNSKFRDELARPLQHHHIALLARADQVTEREAIQSFCDMVLERSTCE
jgi:transposase InsO family protein